MAPARRVVLFFAMKTTTRLPAAGLLLVLLACLTVPGARAQASDVLVRAAFLRALNAERAKAGVPPFRLVEQLTEAAQAHAADLARRRSLDLELGSEQRMRARLERLGYVSHAWVESLVSSTGSVDSVVEDWRRRSRDIHAKVMGREFRDLGVGVSRVDGVPVYTLLFAVPEEEFFAHGTAALADLGAVRTAVLSRVNAERRAAGLAPLAANTLLDRAAQRHAEDMLRRSYFSHKGLDGSTILERVQATGYPARTVGENIAEGQFSVDQVMEGWMDSPGHRRNILERNFRELGVGVARGVSEPGRRHRIIWVQNFGRKRR
jgi:uncharacterized protein YkwD